MTKHPAFGPILRDLFRLEPESVHLNHGSFGATPKAVLAAQQEWRDRMEAEPSRFMEFEFRPALRAAAARLAPLIGAEAHAIAMVENATQAVNAVMRSIEWRPGDRILINDQTYGAVRNTARFVARMTGAEIAEWRPPFPAEGPEETLAAFRTALDPTPRLAIIDHVTSQTALALPLAEMVALSRDAGVLALVDGAHAPGMVPVDLKALDADWYTGNCHKWMFAAKGCAFLWANDRVRETLHPAVISHGYEGGFEAEFDWVGTRDGSAQHSLPTALDFMERYGLSAIQAHNRDLALRSAQRVAAAFGTTPGAPAAMTGAMATVRLPDGFGADREAATALRHRLLHEDRIQTRVHSHGGALWVRISSQIYNGIEDADRLAEAILAKRPNLG